MNVCGKFETPKPRSLLSPFIPICGSPWSPSDNHLSQYFHKTFIANLHSKRRSDLKAPLTQEEIENAVTEILKNKTCSLGGFPAKYFT